MVSWLFIWLVVVSWWFNAFLIFLYVITRLLSWMCWVCLDCTCCGVVGWWIWVLVCGVWLRFCFAWVGLVLVLGGYFAFCCDRWGWYNTGLGFGLGLVVCCE